MDKKIINVLINGGIGVIPTDTIYGIVGSALNSKTVEEIYRLKKRSKKKPFIILISNLNDLKKFDIKLTQSQTEFLKKIWPNPVSVVVQNVAFRMPKDENLLKLLKETGPLVSPSANVEGEKPAQTIDEAKKYFADEVAFYFDGGRINLSPSTLIKLNLDGSYKILRKGNYII